ncbi:MAG: 50S ribosomal protein L5 [Verrucomicrobia bacterium]|nr:50S ribosomal protein L5 [Verrucomicrobiota bacterium]MBS0635941.1 50S ribosomal protein L5 [Verrucomicrobiota bacterium]
MSRLKQRFNEHVRPALLAKFKYANKMMIPSMKKIVISMGIAEASKDKNAVIDCINEITLISGQKPIVTRAKKAISNFKLREDQAIGLKVTLRGQRMLDFMDRFCNIAAPRIRDFRGFNSKADGRGNYSLGLEDQMIFPELNLDKVKRSQGMNITFVTSAQNDEECVELLRLMGMPFKEKTVLVPEWHDMEGGKA